MTRALNIDPAIDAPDDFYQALIEAHRGLSDHGSEQLNCRLILLLANQIGDARLLAEAITLARAGLDDRPETSSLSLATPAAPSHRTAG